ncbi:alternate-type signal peptide domain-containing protein [Georgenia sp. AZ-5]|uniref:alternate-type signal peptide domain-containing protein n=1 Tax=Georgenia sp. AZ-5 TaxID=3367526 RepID=UPI00375477DE
MSPNGSAQHRASSKKATKGIVAGVAGVALLTAGGASFATWQDDYLAEGSIEAGELSLETGDAAGSWTLNGREVTSAHIAALRVVPGDQLVFSDTVVLTAEGDNLKATLRTSLGNVGELADDVSTTFTVRGTTYTQAGALVEEISGNEGTMELPVSVTITFPKEATGGQGEIFDFSGTGLLLQQTA